MLDYLVNKCLPNGFANRRSAMLSAIACICAITMIFWFYNIIIIGMTLEFLISMTALTALLLLVRFCFRGRIRASVIHGLWILIVLRLLLCAIFSFGGENSAPEGRWSANRMPNRVVQTFMPEQSGGEERSEEHTSELQSQR